jgi:hypothetical protein
VLDRPCAVDAPSGAVHTSWTLTVRILCVNTAAATSQEWIAARYAHGRESSRVESSAVRPWARVEWSQYADGPESSRVKSELRRGTRDMGASGVSTPMGSSQVESKVDCDAHGHAGHGRESSGVSTPMARVKSS